MPKESQNTTFINIVSGKGGTGKTLFSAILAEMLAGAGASVLIIDMDVFVRGLTALLYFHKGQSLKLTQEGDWTISDIFTHKLKSDREWKQVRLGAYRYKSFYICPSVPHIDALLNFNDLAPNTRSEAMMLLWEIAMKTDKKYDYVILDSRAGYDELIAATHLISDMSICVQEDDDISNVTADNLVKQLEKDASNMKHGDYDFEPPKDTRQAAFYDWLVLRKEKRLFTIINKARRVKTEEDLAKYGRGLSFLGAIPFDIDVMNSFGEKTFWEDISQSLYKKAVANIWNNLAEKMDFPHKLTSTRVSPFPGEKLEKKLAVLTMRDRILTVYGFAFGFIGLLFALSGKRIFYELIEDPFRLVGLIMGVLGMVMALSSIFRGQQR